MVFAVELRAQTPGKISLVWKKQRYNRTGVGVFVAEI